MRKYAIEYKMRRMRLETVEMIKQLINKGVNLNIVNKVNNIISYILYCCIII